MKTFLTSIVLLCQAVVFADISKQDANDFAVRCFEILRTDNGAEKLKAFVSDAGTNAEGSVGIYESYRFSQINAASDYDVKKLNIEHIFVREPDLDNPLQIRLKDDTSASFLVCPEKIVIIYLENAQKSARVVLFMPLVSSRGKIMLCPMQIEHSMSEKSSRLEADKFKEFPLNKNLSTILGLKVIKVADDNDSYGFPPSGQEHTAGKVFETNPQGCSLQQILLQVINPGVWATGLDNLPPGRFSVHCEVSENENKTVDKKLLLGLADIFHISIKMEDKFSLAGYRVKPPDPWPDSFQKSKCPEGQSAWHGDGDFEGYTLDELLSHALYERPVELLCTNSSDRYDVQLKVWPEAYGEMAAMQKLGFEIVPIKIEKKTLVVGEK